MTALGERVLSITPDELRAAAGMLRQLEGELTSLTAGLERAGEVSGPGWTGLAALAHRARVESLRGWVSLTLRPGQECAAVLDRCAHVAEDAGHRVRALGHALELTRAEQARLRALGPPPDPAGLTRWRARLTELEVEATRVLRDAARTEEETDQVLHQAARSLVDSWQQVTTALGHLGTIVGLGGATTKVVKKTLPGALAGATLVAITLARRQGRLAAPARRIADRRLAAWEERRTVKAEPKPRLRVPVPPLVERLAGPVGAVMTVADAGRRVVDGGGYDGARGGVTRVLGGAAVIGVPLTFVSLPVVAMAGAVAVGTYSAWMAGNWVYDNRHRIVETGRVVQRAVRRADEAMLRQAERAAGSVQRAVRRADEAMVRQVERAAGSVQRGAERAAGAVQRSAERAAEAVHRGAERVSGAVTTSARRAAHWTVRNGLGLALRSRALVSAASERLGDRLVRDMATLGARSHEVIAPLRDKLRRAEPLRLFKEPLRLPRLPVELPSLDLRFPRWTEARG